MPGRLLCPNFKSSVSPAPTPLNVDLANHINAHPNLISITLGLGLCLGLCMFWRSGVCVCQRIFGAHTNANTHDYITGPGHVCQKRNSRECGANGAGTDATIGSLSMRRTFAVCAGAKTKTQTSPPPRRSAANATSARRHRGDALTSAPTSSSALMMNVWKFG